MDQSVALFPEDQLIGLKVELCGGGASIDWALSVSMRCCNRANFRPTLGDLF